MPESMSMKQGEPAAEVLIAPRILQKGIFHLALIRC